MAAFVTLENVKTSLRILQSDSDDDDLLAFLIQAASGAIINYLKSAADQYLDSGGEVPSGMEIPAEIRLATIFLVGVMYRSPDQDEDGAFERGYLPAPVTALLYPLRDPALA